MPESTFICEHCGNRTTGTPHLVAGYRWCDHCYNTETFECAICHDRERRYNRRRHATLGYICRVCHEREATWMQASFQVETTYKKTRSERKFGVELETHSCDGYEVLRGQTKFGAKYDCSVSGMEFVSPILYGDAGLDAVQTFCNLAESKGFTVDTDCGYHLHLDMGKESEDALKSVAYAYLKTDALWRLLVDVERAESCGYCRHPGYNRRHLANICPGDMESFCDNTDRYTLCNLQAYTKFGTYEIRLHQGSVNGKEVCNWIRAHLAFVEWAVDKTFDEIDAAFNGSDADKWESLKAIMGDIDLNRYYGRRRRSRLNVSV